MISTRARKTRSRTRLTIANVRSRRRSFHDRVGPNLFGRGGRTDGGKSQLEHLLTALSGQLWLAAVKNAIDEVSRRGDEARHPVRLDVIEKPAAAVPVEDNRRRVEQLRDSGALYFDLELDMPTFGFRSTAWLWMSVPPSHLAEVGAALAKFPEVAYAVATTGPANLAACVVCRDAESLYEFLTAKVGPLPGVERVESSPVIRTVKQASPVATRP